MAELRLQQLLPVMNVAVSLTQIYPPIVRIPPRNADRTRPWEFLSLCADREEFSQDWLKQVITAQCSRGRKLTLVHVAMSPNTYLLIVAPSRFISIQRKVRVRASLVLKHFNFLSRFW